MIWCISGTHRGRIRTVSTVRQSLGLPDDVRSKELQPGASIRDGDLIVISNDTPASDRRLQHLELAVGLCGCELEMLVAPGSTIEFSLYQAVAPKPMPELNTIEDVVEFLDG